MSKNGENSHVFPCPGCGQSGFKEGDWASIFEEDDVHTTIGFQHRIDGEWTECPSNTKPTLV